MSNPGNRQEDEDSSDEGAAFVQLFQGQASSSVTENTGDACVIAVPDSARNPNRVALQTASASFVLGPRASASANGLPDFDKMLEYLERCPQTMGLCALRFREAWEYGGGNSAGHPVGGRDYGNFLHANKCDVVATGMNGMISSGYVAKKYDIAIIKCPGERDGHIEIFDGKYWRSDHCQDTQSGIWAGPEFKASGSMIIFRPPEQQNKTPVVTASAETAPTNAAISPIKPSNPHS